MNSKNLFRSREAVQYLIEDNEIALIELQAKLKMQPRLISFVNNIGGITGNSEPSLFVGYLYEELHKKSLIEMEILREKINRNYLRTKAEMLWQK